MTDIWDKPIKMKESDVRSGFSKAMRKYGVFAQAIESGATGAGIPDLFIMRGKNHAWIEFKVLPEQRYKDRGFSPHWEEGQMTWGLDYKQHGGKWFLVLAIGKDIYYTSETKERYYLEDLKPVKDFLNDF